MPATTSCVLVGDAHYSLWPSSNGRPEFAIRRRKCLCHKVNSRKNPPAIDGKTRPGGSSLRSELPAIQDQAIQSAFPIRDDGAWSLGDGGSSDTGHPPFVPRGERSYDRSRRGTVQKDCRRLVWCVTMWWFVSVQSGQTVRRTFEPAGSPEPSEHAFHKGASCDDKG